MDRWIDRYNYVCIHGYILDLYVHKKFRKFAYVYILYGMLCIYVYTQVDM